MVFTKWFYDVVGGVLRSGGRDLGRDGQEYRASRAVHGAQRPYGRGGEDGDALRRERGVHCTSRPPPRRLYPCMGGGDTEGPT